MTRQSKLRSGFALICKFNPRRLTWLSCHTMRLPVVLLQFDRIELPESTESLRREVRAFIGANSTLFGRPNSDFTTGHDPEFSAKLGAKGWIGMTWPRAYGGGERTFFERYVVTEELLAAGAPVSAHWIADRQSGPLLLRFGSPEQCEQYLPAITRGESFFSIGMSEPNSGSDLASVRTKATRKGDGWLINGTKLWSTDAHRNHFMIALVRSCARPHRQKIAMRGSRRSLWIYGPMLCRSGRSATSQVARTSTKWCLKMFSCPPSASLARPAMAGSR